MSLWVPRWFSCASYVVLLYYIRFSCCSHMVLLWFSHGSLTIPATFLCDPCRFSHSPHVDLRPLVLRQNPRPGDGSLCRIPRVREGLPPATPSVTRSLRASRVPSPVAEPNPPLASYGLRAPYVQGTSRDQTFPAHQRRRDVEGRSKRTMGTNDSDGKGRLRVQQRKRKRENERKRE